MWFWYVARPDELMLDVDGGMVSSDLGPTRIRLNAAIRSGGLAVTEAYLYRSLRARHYHLIVRLAHTLDPFRRAAWEMQLRSDLYRARNDIMRAADGVPAASLLIAPRIWRGFYREPDAMCRCDAKHKWPVWSDCPAAERLRGDQRAVTYFGELPTDRAVAPLSMTEGPIDLAAFIATHKAGEGSG